MDRMINFISAEITNLQCIEAADGLLNKKDAEDLQFFLKLKLFIENEIILQRTAALPKPTFPAAKTTEELHQNKPNARRASSPARSDEEESKKYKALADDSSDSDAGPRGDVTRRPIKQRKPAQTGLPDLPNVATPEEPAPETMEFAVDAQPLPAANQNTRGRKPPPIMVKDENNNFPKVRGLLLSYNIKCEKDYYGQLIQGGFKIQAKQPATYKEIVKVLKDAKILFHCYELPESQNIKVVIRSLPIYYKPEEIEEELKIKGYDIIRVNQLKRRRDGEIHLLPLFLVTLSRKEENKAIRQERFLLGMKITVESYKGRAGPLQCYRCQGFHHAQSNCHHGPKCVKCGDDHNSYMCTKDKGTPPKCANCLQVGHTANYRGCEKFPKPKPAQTTKTYADRFVTNKSYAQALNSGLAPESIIEAKQVLNELKMFVELIRDSGLPQMCKQIATFKSSKTQDSAKETPVNG